MIANLVRLTLFAAVSALTGCSLVYKADNYLYMRDPSAEDHSAHYHSNQVREAVAKAMATKNPIVLFIHGRGDEPKKSMKGNSPLTLSYWFDSRGEAVRKLEGAYGVTVMLFSWDSRRSTGTLNVNFVGRCRPLAKAMDGAERLRIVIDELMRIPPSERPKIVLLAHSMGTWVVKNYVEERHEGFPPGLFTNVILSSADVDNVRHDKWVAPLTETAKVYITTNSTDPTLAWAESSCRMWGVKPMGVDTRLVQVPGVRYVDFSGTKAHEIFDPHHKFYDAVLKGGSY
jgi:hypothetical protein